MNLFQNSLLVFSLVVLVLACREKNNENGNSTPISVIDPEKIKVIYDTDANNELDDQHAQAYLLLNQKTFEIKGITVNATFNGGDIQNHFDEAERVLKLCNLERSIPLLKGANGSFQEISKDFDSAGYDGQEGVDFLLETSKEDSVIIIAVGKLTNIALALKKDPSFAKRSKIVWLGSNYPEPGEYNQDNDTIAMNYVLNSTIPFEMVTVRYGKPSGTDAVKVTQEEINKKMPGLGPKIKEPIIGRHGGSFDNFGDYSVSLFEHIDYHGDPPSRSLFDMVAVAILKNSDWAKQSSIPAPIFINNAWVERPANKRKIVVWENFDKQGIMDDFYLTLKESTMVNTTN